MTTTTETRNFKEVTISSVILPDGKKETMIFYNHTEVVAPLFNKKSLEDNHRIAVKFAMNNNLVFNGRDNILTR